MRFLLFFCLIIGSSHGRWNPSGGFNPMHYYQAGEPSNFQAITTIPINPVAGFIYFINLEMHPDKLSRRSFKSPLTSWQMAYNDSKKYGSRKAELAKLLYNYNKV